MERGPLFRIPAQIPVDLLLTELALLGATLVDLPVTAEAIAGGSRFDFRFAFHTVMLSNCSASV